MIHTSPLAPPYIIRLQLMLFIHDYSIYLVSFMVLYDLSYKPNHNSLIFGLSPYNCVKRKGQDQLLLCYNVFDQENNCKGEYDHVPDPFYIRYQPIKR